jgi:hypothetical protein
MEKVKRPPPGFEPGLQAPQACTLPGYVTAATIASASFVCGLPSKFYSPFKDLKSTEVEHLAVGSCLK